MTQSLSDDLALRIGLAARSLPETTPGRLMAVLVDAFGLPLTEAKLAGVTPKLLKTALDGQLADIDGVYLKQAAYHLKSTSSGPVSSDPPPPGPYRDGDMPGSIRVGFASNSGERLDGHFGSCARFLIYQVSASEARLIDVRPVVEPDSAIKDDINAYRAGLISDCHILYLVSIGGPPAAKVVKAGVHPVKLPQETDIRTLLPSLQETLAGTPPPWLAKAMNTAVGDAV
jgi:nitrogen fixation protein NifX